MRLLRASLLKLVRRPATVRAPLVLAALVALIYLSIGVSAGANPEAHAGVDPMLAFPGAHLALASMLLMFSGIVGAAYAGAVAASEWSWNTYRTALARGESRARYVTGLFVAIALLTLVAWLVLYVLGVGVIVAVSSLGGVAGGDPFTFRNATVIPAMIASGGWAALMLIAIGFAVSFVSRSAVAGVATVVALIFIEQFAAMTSIPADLLRFAPVTAAASLVSTAGDVGLDAAIVLPLVVTTAYLLLAIGIAAASGRRAQVA